MMRQKFETRLVAKGPKNAWTHLVLPFPALKVFGTKARVPVRGTMNGFPFRKSIMPVGDGTHYMSVDKKLQVGAKAKAGDIVQVVLQRDEEERTVEIPTELQHVLEQDSAAAEVFRSLSYSRQKEYADWIATAKRPETKIARTTQALERLRVKKPLH